VLEQALEGFTPEQQKAFLRFVTACSRPPLLGFKHLDPALCVQVPPALPHLPCPCYVLLVVPAMDDSRQPSLRALLARLQGCSLTEQMLLSEAYNACMHPWGRGVRVRAVADGGVGAE
jgi:hypothetical protein